MNRAQIGDIALAYEVRGSGQPVVLIHGSFIADGLRPLMAEPLVDGTVPAVSVSPAWIRQQHPLRCPDEHRAAGGGLPRFPGTHGHSAGPRRWALLQRKHCLTARAGCARRRPFHRVARASVVRSSERAATDGILRSSVQMYEAPTRQGQLTVAFKKSSVWNTLTCWTARFPARSHRRSQTPTPFSGLKCRRYSSGASRGRMLAASSSPSSLCLAPKVTRFG